MEGKYGKIRNAFCSMGISLAIIYSITQVLDIAKDISFYFALGSLSSLFIELVLVRIIFLDSKKRAGK